MSGAAQQKSRRVREGKCAGCEIKLASRVSYCPYCGVAQARPNEPEPAIAEVQNNVISFPRGAEQAPAENAANQPEPVATAPFPTVVADMKPRVAAPEKSPTLEVKPPASTPAAKVTEPPAPQKKLDAPAQTTATVAAAVQTRPAKKSRRWMVTAAIVVIGFLVLRSVLTAPPPPQQITAFVTRDEAVLRDAPSSQGAEVTRLARGARLEGTYQAGAQGGQWLKLGGGPFAGDYVSQTNLSAAAPPALVRAINGNMPTLQTAALQAAPDYGSAVLQHVPAGLSVFVVGTTADGWLEIALRRGGVGYLPRSAFQ